MKTMGGIWISVAALCAIIMPACGMTTLLARYNMGGVTGTVTFTQSNIGEDVDIELDLNNLDAGTYMLQLHELRVNFDTLNICSEDNIGAMIGAAEATSGRGNLTASGIDLSGTKSIEGRSFVITNGSLTVCATIEADTDYITAYAQFPATLGGTVIFRQKESSQSADTLMYLDLYFVGTTEIAAPLRWQINSGQVKMDIDATTSLNDRCGSTIGDLYDPDAASGIGCTTEDHTHCRIGDLSAKHGNVTLQTTENTKLFFGDLRLPLSGDNSIIGKTIAFLNGEDYFACANIVQYPRMEGVAKFSNDGVKGMIKFKQRSPLDPVTVNIDLDNLKSKAGGYHVHLYPVPQKRGMNEAVCDADDVAGHFNPFNVDVDSSVYPSATSTTPDMYEVGDISGKFGTLANLSSYNETWIDPNLQLYGSNSIIGRSVVIHKNQPNSPRWICSTIWPGEGIAMNTAYARFTFPFIGYMLFRQPRDMWFAETQVYVELNYAAMGNQTATQEHTWHVHETAIGADRMVSREQRCVSVGDHYNPYDVDLGGDYASQCRSNKQVRCELGDLSGKHGKLNIRTASGQKTKYFFTDIQLPLSGPQSIVGKSIVIHNNTHPSERLGCADVILKYPRTAMVNAWTAADGQGSPTGTITFSQDCVDILSCPTTVHVELSGLKNQVAGYHVHETPTGPDTRQSQLCLGSDTGGHLNPFGAPYPLYPGNSSLDQYEIGDLSGKFHPLTGTSYSTNVLDINLPMEGPFSIVGRSIVIHRNDIGAARWACGNIMETTPGSRLIQAKAEFVGEIFGSIYFSQYKYSNGDLSNTFIVVDVKYRNGSQTTGHNWHVHVSRVITDCASCGPHYNPFMVDVMVNYDECSIYNPLRCEMGDQSKKLGQYTIGGGKKFYTDVNLNLEATYSAAKRSVVFHGGNGAPERIACASIIPYGDSAVISDLSFTRRSYHRPDVEEKVAQSIGTDVSNVLVTPKVETISCSTVAVYFLGDDKHNLRRQFQDVLRSGDTSQLGVFAPSGDCVTGSSSILRMSLITVFICLCLTKLRLL